MDVPEIVDAEKVRTLASGLHFPEGPAVDRDGSVIVPEIESGTVVRIRPDGGSEPIADVGGGANGVAFGPDGALYVCNNGGYIFAEQDGQRFPAQLPDGYEGGSLQRVDLSTGAVETLFTESEGVHLGGLNDIVFDTSGSAYVMDTTGSAIHYFDPAAGTIRAVASDLAGPNGAGLSPDGTRLYVSESYSGRVRVWEVAGPGRLVELPDLYRHPASDLFIYWDGLAVDGAGNVCVADPPNLGVTVLGPDGAVRGRFVPPVVDGYPTNLCFGGAAGNTAYVCSGGRGLLYEVPWPWPGLRLNFQP